MATDKGSERPVREYILEEIDSLTYAGQEWLRTINGDSNVIIDDDEKPMSREETILYWTNRLEFIGANIERAQLILEQKARGMKQQEILSYWTDKDDLDIATVHKIFAQKSRNIDDLLITEDWTNVSKEIPLTTYLRDFIPCIKQIARFGLDIELIELNSDPENKDNLIAIIKETLTACLQELYHPTSKEKLEEIQNKIIKLREDINPTNEPVLRALKHAELWLDALQQNLKGEALNKHVREGMKLTPPKSSTLQNLPISISYFFSLIAKFPPSKLDTIKLWNLERQQQKIANYLATQQGIDQDETIVLNPDDKNSKCYSVKTVLQELIPYYMTLANMLVSLKESKQKDIDVIIQAIETHLENFRESITQNRLPTLNVSTLIDKIETQKQLLIPQKQEAPSLTSQALDTIRYCLTYLTACIRWLTAPRFDFNAYVEEYAQHKPTSYHLVNRYKSELETLRKTESSIDTQPKVGSDTSGFNNQ